jgi:3-hydroxyacyl-CoA dehydrogenase
VATGWTVRIRDPSEKSRNDALSYLKENITSYTTLSRRSPGTFEAVDDLATAVKDAWLIIECVPEILALKESTFADLEKYAPPDAILASNSSSYKCSDLLGKVSAETKKRCLNTHYMMPPQVSMARLLTL